ncbi:hypothetical protein CEK25_009364 [Fusarium fujikuroi]|nr:hypothetical protein CEK25_009364 [Fusarium fujikuroi]
MGRLRKITHIDGTSPSDSSFHTPRLRPTAGSPPYKMTVREALEFSVTMGVFSANAEISRLTNDAYVEDVIDMLDMQEFHLSTMLLSERLVFSGSRADELAYVEDVIGMLDMPQLSDGGLDSQTSWRFAIGEKLTASGQAVLCTIHQPSAMLFQTSWAICDRLLLLAPGGKTTSAPNPARFERNGAPPCPEVRQPRNCTCSRSSNLDEEAETLINWHDRRDSPPSSEEVKPAENFHDLISAFYDGEADECNGDQIRSLWPVLDAVPRGVSGLKHLPSTRRSPIISFQDRDASYHKLAIKTLARPVHLYMDSRLKITQEYLFKACTDQLYAIFMLALPISLQRIYVRSREHHPRSTAGTVSPRHLHGSLTSSNHSQHTSCPTSSRSIGTPSWTCHNLLLVQYPVGIRPQHNFRRFQAYILSNFLVEAACISFMDVIMLFTSTFSAAIVCIATAEDQAIRGVIATLYLWMLISFCGTLSHLPLDCITHAEQVGVITTKFWMLHVSFCQRPTSLAVHHATCVFSNVGVADNEIPNGCSWM